MIDFKFKIVGVLLIFMTVSLIFKMDLNSQIEYTFDTLDINVSELADKQIDKILSHVDTETFNLGYYTYPMPETIENKITSDKYQKLTNIIDLEKDYNALIIRGYEADEYVTARYYVEESVGTILEDIVSIYQEKLNNVGYEEKDGLYSKDNIEISFLVKWDCITLIVKGL